MTRAVFTALAVVLVLALGQRMAEACVNFGGKCGSYKRCCSGSYCKKSAYWGDGFCLPGSPPPFKPPFKPPPPFTPPPPTPPPPPRCTPTNRDGCDSAPCCNPGDLCVAKGSQNVCTPPSPPPPVCIPRARGCTPGGAGCCNPGDSCLNGVCAPPCVPQGLPCGNGGGSCCTPNVCTGTCVPPSTPPPPPPPPPPSPPPPTGPCACKKPVTLVLRNISNSPFTYDPSRTGKKSGSGSGKKKSSKKKSGSGAFVSTFVPPTGIQTVAPGATFTVATSGKSATNIGPVEIHTSCSDDLGIGQTFCGLLEIVGGTNSQGTSLCPVTTPQRKSKCSSFG